MKVDIADVSAVRKRMTIELPGEDVERAFRRAVGRVARKVRIAGFRQGKAPEWVIRQRFGEDVREEVKESLTRESVTSAFKERSIEPLGPPVLEASHLVEGEPFRLTLRFEVPPAIVPRDYLGQKVARSEQEVTVEDVQEDLRRMQEAHAYLVPVEGRGAAAGDVALVDLEGHDPRTGAALRHESLSIVVDAEGNLPAFNEALRDRRPGDATPFEVTYPADYHVENLRSQRVAYTLKVRELKRRQVPDLDDDLARDAAGLETLAALREAVRARLGEVRKLEADRVARDRLLGKIADAHDFEVPETLVESHLDARLQDLVGGLIAQGIDPRRVDVDWKAVREEQRGKAVAAVKRMLLLDAIAAKEGLQVTAEDLARHLDRAAKARGETAQALRNRLKKEGRLQAIQNQLLREKCLDFVYVAARITSDPGS